MLRASEYDEIRAAKRLIQYFTFKLKLFGMDKLTKTITQDDLTPSMQERLRSGGHQMMPQKDRAGRVIFFSVPTPPADGDHEEDWRTHASFIFVFYSFIFYQFLIFI